VCRASPRDEESGWALPADRYPYEALVALGRHRVLDTTQIARLTGQPLRATQRELAELHERGLVAYLRTSRGSGSAARHWWLTHRGARLVGTVTAAGAKPSPAFVRRASAIAEVWLAVREHGPAAGIEPVDWLVGRAAKQRRVVDLNGYGVARELALDAVLRARLPTGDTVAAVEVDLATSVPRLRRRMAELLRYADDHAWQGKWPHCPPVLMLTTTPHRAGEWIAAATRLADAHDRDRGVNRRYAHRGADGQLLRAADRLVIACCELAGQPAAAVTGRVWRVADEPGRSVTLAELLGERVAAQALASDVLDRIEVRTRSPEQQRVLHEIAHSAEPARLLGPAQAEILAQLAADTAEFARRFPDLADRLLVWWAQRHTGDAWGGSIRADLLTLHRRRWALQAHALLSAAGVDPDAADPRLSLAAAELAAGRLLPPHPPGETAEPPPADAADQITDFWLGPYARQLAGFQNHRQGVQEAELRGYRARREEAAKATWRGLGWWARRRSSWESFTAAYDDEHLLVCDMCGLLAAGDLPGRPRDDPSGCPACHAGRLVPHTRRREVPALADHLDAVRRLLRE
jgi:hypothetical protein